MTKPRNFDEVLAKLPDAKSNQNGEWTASCPCAGHGTPAKHLSLKDGGDKALVHCHPDGKHTLDEIMAALGYTSLKYGQARTKRSKIDKAYSYTDADGKVLFQVVRMQPKDFWQRRPDGEGGWIKGLGGMTPVLYRLKDVTAAVADGQDIYVVEGEKDADNLWRVGIAATTNAMGAGKWHDRYAETLRGANVVIIPDADTPGFRHAREVAASCYGKATSVRILELPECKDVTDWLNAGHMATELKALAEQAPPYDAAQFEQARPKDTWTPAYATAMTDMGNGERLAKVHGDKLRYCVERNTWLIWTGKVWRWDTGNHRIRDMAKHTVRQIYREIADEPDQARCKELRDHAKRSEHDNRIDGMIHMAQTEPGMAVEMAELDANQWILNVLNGTIDLRTGELRPHDKADMNTIMVPIEYHQDAECDLWMGFLNQVMDGNQDLITYLQRCVGYSLTGSIREQVFFLLYGTGNNGKSTFVAAIRKLTGDYGHRLDIDDLMARDARLIGTPRPGIAALRGKRFVATTEVRDGRHMDTGRVKDMTGGETMTARFLYQNEFEFAPQFKLWLSGNTRPTVTDNTLAMWRRVKQIPFTVTIPPGQVDPDFGARLEPELPGILAWAVRGCLDWQTNETRLGEPQAVIKATEAYRHEQDVLAEFIEDSCILRKGATVPKSELRRQYESWCETNGVEPVKQRTFRARLVERGIGDDRTSDNKTRIWKGIRLKTDMDKADFSDKTDKTDRFGRKSPL